MKVEPLLSPSDVQVMVPPMASAILKATKRPRPVPEIFNLSVSIKRIYLPAQIFCTWTEGL